MKVSVFKMSFRTLLVRTVAVPHGKMLYSTIPTTFVKRTTLFKIPKEEDIDAVLRQYEVLKQTAVKDGQPYIVSNSAKRVINTSSPRSEGFTLSSQSIFRTHEDHDFYDKECPAHQALRVSQIFRLIKITCDILTSMQEVTGKVKTGVMTIVTEGEWPEPRL